MPIKPPIFRFEHSATEFAGVTRDKFEVTVARADGGTATISFERFGDHTHVNVEPADKIPEVERLTLIVQCQDHLAALLEQYKTIKERVAAAVAPPPANA